ncbi:MAG: RagB/SusD family nutrient uptake outer membrane protein [Candidatus Pedobacter colombiensis]|uniref:RagB/SusD family nutrient uptake outer membrane protein n=1 Tax=Candidatus Pedobacter colombiensis TaxID=3121371 RepID=A0AAJ5W9M6_9SPHI|nr:RagB/SusD family nutrient uptake outer membrane protein [Pedobacter sp.]WEK20572.1 MAG: RagB/SusD family nutrient uptake outer membrane protein [Pedobacter sp.]
MKKIFLLLVAITGIMTTGCKKFLDVKPKGYTIPSTFDDYQRLLNNQSLYRVSSAYPNFLTDDARAGERSDPNRATEYPLLALYLRNLYEFKPGPIYDQGAPDTFWEPAYAHIFIYNTVINNIEKVPDGTDATRKQLKAEAQIGRAFEYLTLVNGYANHYNPVTAATDLGVPILLSEDINAPYKRNTVAEVYAQIQKDLDEALPNLAATAPNNFHPIKSVGFAFLSKMYLYMGNYAEALKNVNEALKLNSALIDYKLYTTKNGTTFGRVCTKLDPLVPFPDANKSIESVWVRNGASSIGDLNAAVYASDDLLATYRANLPVGATDQRLALFFCNGVSNFGSAPVFFPGRYLWAPYFQANFGFSTPELLLIAAECEARVGSKDKAVGYLDVLRNSRIINNIGLSAATNDIALKLALDERRREMPFLGITRLTDLKRLNMDSRFAKTVTHVTGTQSFQIPANDNRYILPLPPKVLEFNPTIPQYQR